jgi:hypothetical protein
VIVEQPPLSGVYMAHFGVKGMKWGQRKVDAISAKAKQAATPTNWNRKQVKTAVIVGSAATAAGLNKFGALKPTLLFTSRYTLKGVGAVSSMAFNGLLTIGDMTFKAVTAVTGLT